MAALTEIHPVTVADLVEVAGWSSAWHCEERLSEDEARATLAGVLPIGTIVERVEVLGYEAGVDGTVVLVASLYSHS